MKETGVSRLSKNFMKLVGVIWPDYLIVNSNTSRPSNGFDLHFIHANKAGWHMS